MKQKEKLDLILKKLYQSRFKRNYHSIYSIMEELGLYGSLDAQERSDEARVLAKRLKDDGLADVVSAKGFCDLKISSRGIDYCEENSYSQPGTPATSLNITFNGGFHSTNTVLGNNISHVQQTASVVNEAQDLISKIRNELDSAPLNQQDKEDLVDCFDDIQHKIDNGKKVPNLQWKALVNSTSNLATIGGFAIQLAGLFGFPIPTP